MSSLTPQPSTPPIIACTVSRDVQNFDLLIEDMEAALGETWGDLRIDETLAFLNQSEAEALEFIAVALNSADESNLLQIQEIIERAKSMGIKVILVAQDLTPPVLHKLLRAGADEFIPHPLPSGELQQAIDRLRSAHNVQAMPSASQPYAPHSQRLGSVISVNKLAGGTGATTLATNLAWELATIDTASAPSVCLIDLDLQFGAVATYLDLPRRDVVYEMLSDTESMDEEVFMQALLPYEDKIQVLTAPSDMLPLDLLTPADIERIFQIARQRFDYVVVDMPASVVQWTETVFSLSDLYIPTLELDMRSAQNALRFKRTLVSEGLAMDKVRFALNRAPKLTDITGRSRVKALADSLSIKLDILLSDGSKQVTQSADEGVPLANSVPKNPLRREIAKLATSIYDLRSEPSKAA